MKLPSIKKLTESASAVIKHFPFEMLFAFTGTIAGTALTELESTARVAENWCLRTIMMANLGLLLSLAVTLYTESKKISGVQKWAFKMGIALFAVALIFILNPFDREADRIRFFLLSLAFHLLVAFAAFTAKGQINGFWQFNKVLFLRFLTSFLYSGVLFAGISAALGAMNFLFNFKFEWDTFVILWIWIAGMFNTMFFLAGVPDDLQALDKNESYPKGLKVFTQYVLIPLATLYVVILLAYEIKILVQWNLPKGLVSDLILGYAVFGILSILLVYPVREQEENKWIKSYARSFYFLMLPLIVLLLLAVGTRVFRYGITEWRYFLIVLAIWLLLITAYFLISKKQNIKLIPISLCIFTLLSVYGPQSAFSVSAYSQRHVLINIFKRNHAYRDGKLMPVDSNKISKKDGNRAAATLEYLVLHHDLTCLKTDLPVDLDKVADSLGKQKNKWNKGFTVNRYELRGDKLTWVKKYLGLNRFSGSHYDDIDIVALDIDYYFSSTESEFYPVSGFDYKMDGHIGENDTVSYHVDNLKISQYNSQNSWRKLSINNEVLMFDIKGQLNLLIKDKKRLASFTDTVNKSSDYQKRYIIPAGMLNITAQSANYKATLVISSVTFNINNNAVTKVSYVFADYLIKIKH